MEGLGAHPSAPLPLGGGISRSFVRPSLWPCHRWLPRLLCTDGGAVWPGSTRPSPWVPPPCSARPAALSSVTDCLCSEGSQPGEEEQALGCSVWPPRSSCQALICMQKGLGGIYRGLTLGSCSRPRNTLGRRRAVGKIRTGPSAATHALVTLQAADIEIIFIYNLFDHPASKRARLV